MNKKDFIKEQYSKFSRTEGSQFITSEYALGEILNFINKFKPENILEVGVGIGTISDSIIKAYKNEYGPKVYGTENNEFCLSKLPENLGKDYSFLKLFPSIQNLPRDIEFDLIIIDGKESNLKSIKHIMNDHCIILVEGDRKEQTEICQNLFPSSKFVHLITSKKNSYYSNRAKEHYQGGIKVIFTDPHFTHFLEWFKLKLTSKFHFQIRKFSR
ncbi:hypothetical protein [Gramella sp. MAR_2010_147]|uniref:hypothetical protein n=1 Tax=Gramella sp. MAR_2010_147 TaxID=1250205 RepID=UPI00087C9215|nr:hypothetical protein [Gramella sp. MAR_2010_147]SDS01349.1 hypothetical protein SAMN04488553_1263 [Gramella sp. MAR_2010_147]